ncbi:MAG: leucine-rich repeat protein, partial [Lachnospiraceae bacterium]|nr:leucine-rich repeat protein [Lachnospiraceae bacterium]
VNISFKLKEDTSWAKKGHEVAHGQIEVPFDVPEVTALKTEDLGELGLEDGQDSAVITGKDFTVTFDKTAGTIKDFTYKGKKLLESGPQPDFWRAPTDSDLGFYSGARYDTWRYAGEDKAVSGVTVKKVNNGMVEITVDSVLPTTTKSSYSQKFTIYGTGDVKVTSKLTPGEGLPEIPVVGNSLTLPKEFSNVTWYGKGPDENYIDRQSGYEIGVYKKDVDDFFIDYIKPQETGNRTETRWVSMTNSDGTGLLAKTDVPMEFSALYYTAEELTNVMHSYMLGGKDRITLRLNQRQMGLGGDNSWGAKPLPPYLNTSDKVYEYSFTLKPVSTADVDASMREYKTVLPTGTDSTPEQPDDGEDKPDVQPELKKGDSALYKNVYYTVADPAKKTAIATKGKNKNITSAVIQKQVTIKGVKCKVVQIGDKAFSGYKKLAKVTVGKNVKTIGKQAFKGSSKLKSITLEKGSALNTVKSGAFKNTSAKMTVKAPGMKAKQRNALLKKMKKAGMGAKAVIK